jgi:23S rRNA (cytidine1920-2'-O)/16S rRNA (cytidine1409-2'-O)-methyltransferase
LKIPFFFSSRAGYKLEAAIEQLGVDVSGKVALDSGLSTGGFTDCLLQYGASFVYGVDVGYGQVIYPSDFISFAW